MNIVKAIFSLLALIVFAASFTSAQDKEVKVMMKDLPAAVRQTVKEQSKSAVVRGLAKEVENGQTFYEVELKVNGHNKDVLIDAGGKVVEIEEQIALESLPPAVKNEIVKQAGKGRVLMVESITKDNSVVAYEAHIKTGSKVSEIKVDPGGKPIAR